MVTINLGGVIGGGNGTTGLISGLDSNAIIEDLKSIRQSEIDNVQTTIDSNSSTISKYGELKTLLNSLKNSTDFLRNSASVNPFSNVFDYRVASLSSSTISNISTFANITTQPGALNGSLDLQIGNIAEALEERSGSFTSRSADATTTSTGSYFGVGTFQIGSGVRTEVDGTVSSDYQLQSTDYSTTGSGSGILTANGIESFNVAGVEGGQEGLQGSISGFSAVVSGAGTTTVSITIDDITYTSNALDHTGAVTGGNGIASGTNITFTADSGGANETSFTVQLASDVVIDGSQDNGDTFAANLDSALSNVSVYQSREIANFNDSNVKTAISGLTSSDIKFINNSFDNSDYGIGTISDFNVGASTGSDGEISIIINGETFRATGLSGTLNSEITLSSSSSDRQLSIDFTGVNADISSDDNARDVERSLEYFLGTRDLVDITVNSGDSLNSVLFRINQQSLNTGVSAGVIQVSDFDFKFNLKASGVGLDSVYEIFDDSNILSNVSLETTQSAEDAVISIDGVEITRSSNNISDAVQDVTFNLFQETPNYGNISAETIEVSVDNDIDAVVTGIESFINAYNELRVFTADQNQRDPETLAFLEESILGGDTLLDGLNSSIISELNSIISTGNSNFNDISDSQIILSDFPGDTETVATNNILNYDEVTLREKLEQNYDDIRKIFELNTDIDSNNLFIAKSSNTASLNEFRLNIDTSQPTGQQVRLQDINGVDILDSEDNQIFLSLSSGRIVGNAGTPVEGYEFIYTGDGSESIDVSITQGIADRIFNIVDSYTEDGGLIDLEVDSITDRNDNLGEEVITLEARLEVYVQGLISTYSALESAVQGFNSILLLLDAQAQVNSNN